MRRPALRVALDGRVTRPTEDRPARTLGHFSTVVWDRVSAEERRNILRFKPEAR